ncbi:hypothetical protein [Actinoplanes cyaneus]|nr:hypothetical protein [Actinoplanes cyaneus]
MTPSDPSPEPGGDGSRTRSRLLRVLRRWVPPHPEVAAAVQVVAGVVLIAATRERGLVAGLGAGLVVLGLLEGLAVLTWQYRDRRRQPRPPR